MNNRYLGKILFSASLILTPLSCISNGGCISNNSIVPAIRESPQRSIDTDLIPYIEPPRKAPIREPPRQLANFLRYAHPQDLMIFNPKEAVFQTRFYDLRYA